MNNNFQPSKYQESIREFVMNGEGNAVVNAVAGSGKTSTLLWILGFIAERFSVLFLAFNKSIADELKGRVPKSNSITVATLNSFGYRACLKAFRGIQVVSTKYNKLLRDIVTYGIEMNPRTIVDYGFNAQQMAEVHAITIGEADRGSITDMTGYQARVIKLSTLGRYNMVNIRDKEQGVTELTLIAHHHGVELVNGECERAWHLIRLGVTVTSICDYTDQIYMTLHYSLPVDRFMFVFIDECQDLNRMQRELMLRTIDANGGRFIAVGDPAQAIYGFAGADADSFKTLQSLPNTISLPLSVCYRCAKFIVDKAKNIVPQIEAREGVKEGIVDDWASYRTIMAGDMVICRLTFPLVALCMKFLSQGIKAYIKGTDIGQNLVNMIKNAERKSEDYTMTNVINRLYAERDKMVSNIINKEKLSREEAMEDNTIVQYGEKVNVIELLAKGITEPALVIEKINAIFSDDKVEGICLSTVHKSKGLEADRVFIIHAEKMPHPMAKKAWQIEQERNLQYVAYTSAKSYLGIVTDFDAYKGFESSENNRQEIRESQFMGKVGEKLHLCLEVIEVREVNTYSGLTNIITMRDSEGNLFSKWNDLAPRFIVSNHNKVQVGSFVEFTAKVKAHQEFKGVKSTVLINPEAYKG